MVMIGMEMKNAWLTLIDVKVFSNIKGICVRVQTVLDKDYPTYFDLFFHIKHLNQLISYNPIFSFVFRIIWLLHHKNLHKWYIFATGAHHPNTNSDKLWHHTRNL
jgi:hypothetical protein